MKMKHKALLPAAVATAALLLTACAGGAGAAEPSAPANPPGITLLEPAPTSAAPVEPDEVETTSPVMSAEFLAGNWRCFGANEHTMWFGTGEAWHFMPLADTGGFLRTENTISLHRWHISDDIFILNSQAAVTNVMDEDHFQILLGIFEIVGPRQLTCQRDTTADDSLRTQIVNHPDFQAWRPQPNNALPAGFLTGTWRCDHFEFYFIDINPFTNTFLKDSEAFESRHPSTINNDFWKRYFTNVFPIGYGMGGRANLAWTNQGVLWFHTGDFLHLHPEFFGRVTLLDDNSFTLENWGPMDRQLLCARPQDPIDEDPSGDTWDVSFGAPFDITDELRERRGYLRHFGSWFEPAPGNAFWVIEGSFHNLTRSTQTTPTSHAILAGPRYWREEFSYRSFFGFQHQNGTVYATQCPAAFVIDSFRAISDFDVEGSIDIPAGESGTARFCIEAPINALETGQFGLRTDGEFTQMFEPRQSDGVINRIFGNR